MKVTYKNITVEIICILYGTLFFYAAISKALDYQKFQVQLGQSPLRSAYADWIAFLVPTIEFILVILLFIVPLRLFALFASFFLMVMFTAYIIIILNFSDFVPCSCGGILEELGWTEHLIFNVAFIILAGVAIWIVNNKKYKNNIKYNTA
ncbi:MAG: MauE/DoxX family redox-associated membrane protein [Polaribacter sp.]|uniref:MauE/DoxX family redox-associated membrane protein n=1 Tax=Polaribacter sp. TaxID=1920175 RepID=UPI002F359D52